MLLHDLGDYLSSQGGWTQGTDLFLGRRPSQPATVTTVYEIGGQAPVWGMSAVAGDAAVERPAVQVVCRSTDYAVARALAQKAWLLLDGLPTRSINGVSYKDGRARQQPFGMGFDDDGRALVACNYDIIKARTTSTN